MRASCEAMVSSKHLTLEFNCLDVLVKEYDDVDDGKAKSDPSLGKGASAAYRLILSAERRAILNLAQLNAVCNKRLCACRPGNVPSATSDAVLV